MNPNDCLMSLQVSNWVLSFACSLPVGGMLFKVSGLLLLYYD